MLKYAQLFTFEALPPQVHLETCQCANCRSEDAGGSLQQDLRTENRSCPLPNVLIVLEKEPTCELELLNKARSNATCRSRSGHVHPGVWVHMTGWPPATRAA